MSARRILFVTGRLAEKSLRRVVEPLAEQQGFQALVEVLPITVAALMTPIWIARRLHIPDQVDEVWLPGYCTGDVGPLRQLTDAEIQVGPRDLHDLPLRFGQPPHRRSDYGVFRIEILAEINHAPHLSLEQLTFQAKELAGQGADIIDIGCVPGESWTSIGDAVRALRDQGLRVSVDSMNVDEIQAACRAGAELVLSVNASNRHAARDWGTEVVAIPDQPRDLIGLDQTLEVLDRHNVPCRMDPIIEPLGCGFANSLGRYLEVRRRYPEAEMLMGVGNLTELTDVDSAGVNVLLLGFCEELGIRSVLTTQVINWARTSVRECDLARRLVHYAVQKETIPKHLEPNLIVLRDEYPRRRHWAELNELARQIRDPNYRIFLGPSGIHLIAAGIHLHDPHPFNLLRQLMALNPKNLDPSHAFYLGYELAKARTALTLDKEYRQDEALDWGYLTVPEPSADHGPKP